MTTQSLEALRDIRALLIDMDGVLWRGKAPLPGLTDFFRLLRDRPLAFRLVTNNAGKTPDQYVDKLAALGVQVTPDEILTSAIATAQYLAAHAPGALVYVIGTDGLRQALLGHGLRLSSGDHADYVVVGWDQELTFRKLADATLLIRAGAKFIGTNPDVTWPDEQVLLPGNGATLAYLQASTSVAPLIIGKPERPMFDAALAALGADPPHAAMLGDRLETDILGGQNAGLRGILVLTGATDRAALDASPVQPDWVFDSIQDLTRAWTGLSQ
jgi:4-nitrophenyl phosphatase